MSKICPSFCDILEWFHHYFCLHFADFLVSRSVTWPSLPLEFCHSCLPCLSFWFLIPWTVSPGPGSPVRNSAVTPVLVRSDVRTTSDDVRLFQMPFHVLLGPALHISPFPEGTLMACDLSSPYCNVEKFGIWFSVCCKAVVCLSLGHYGAIAECGLQCCFQKKVRKHRTDPILRYCEPVTIQCFRGINFQVLGILKWIHSTVKKCD